MAESLVIYVNDTESLELTPITPPSLAFYQSGIQGERGIQGVKGDTGDTGPQGPPGSGGSSARVFREVNASGPIVLADNFIRIVTAGINLTLPTLNSTFQCTFKNVSNGNVTLTAAGGQDIEGETSIQLLTGQSRTLSGRTAGADVC